MSNKRAPRGLKWLLRFGILAIVAEAALASFAGCGSEDRSEFQNELDANVQADGPQTPFSPSLGDGSATGDAAANCTGLACKRVFCPGGKTTTLSGKVVSPRPGDPDPIYNAIVYVPNAPVEPFSEGVSCERCGATVSGHPIAVASTGIDGTFVLKDVPVSDDLPLVIQLGRWRRQLTVKTVTACADTPLAVDLTRFPRNHTEGDIPKMALKTGDSDSPECVLRKMGIDEAEFQKPGGPGRIDLYYGILAKPPTLDGGIPDAGPFLDDLAAMKKYDMVLLPCDGNAFTPDRPSMQNLESYAGVGGKIFASHYSYEWIKNAPAPSQWPTLVNWDPSPTIPGASEVVPGYINTTFPKGKAMSDWLENLGAASNGVIASLWQPRRDVDSLASGSEALGWITTKTPDRLNHFSFNAPVGADAGDQCGRVVFNDFHTVNVYAGQTGIFPAECGDKTQPLTPQERVFEFMLFDLSSCVQKDDLPPIEPPVVPR